MSDLTTGRAPAVERERRSTRAWVSALPGVLIVVRRPGAGSEVTE
jgi:hypothetical protein